MVARKRAYAARPAGVSSHTTELNQLNQLLLWPCVLACVVVVQTTAGSEPTAVPVTGCHHVLLQVCCN